LKLYEAWAISSPPHVVTGRISFLVFFRWDSSAHFFSPLRLGSYGRTRSCPIVLTTLISEGRSFSWFAFSGCCSKLFYLVWSPEPLRPLSWEGRHANVSEVYGTAHFPYLFFLSCMTFVFGGGESGRHLTLTFPSSRTQRPHFWLSYGYCSLPDLNSFVTKFSKAITVRVPPFASGGTFLFFSMGSEFIIAFFLRF